MLRMLRLGGAKQTAASSPMMRPSFHPSSRILLHASIALQSLAAAATIQGNEDITKKYVYRVATTFEACHQPGSLRWLGKRESSEKSWYHVRICPHAPYEKEKPGILVEDRSVVPLSLFVFLISSVCITFVFCKKNVIVTSCESHALVP